MLVVSLVGQKGGTGKSLLAINLAVLAQAEDLKTCIVDLDPQGTVRDWYASRSAETPAVLASHQVPEIELALGRLRSSGFELVIIDTPGTDPYATRGAMAAADLCLVPLRPSGADLNATIPSLKALEAMDRLPRAALVLNLAPANRQARLTLAVTRRLEAIAC